MNETKIFLNTWGSYNDGCIGYGWMNPQEAMDFIENNPDIDGGEFFIADIDNYLGINFGTLEYANIAEVCDVIETLEAMEEWERENVIALMEYLGNSYSIQDVIECMDNHTFYSSLEQYHDFCDELIEMELNNDSIVSRYFDYDSYHRDCDFDIYEASNGVCIA